MKRPRQSQTGGPTAERYPCKGDSLLNDELQCQEAIALMKHTADEAVVKEKMRLTLAYRQKLLHDPKESTDILSIFPRFQDIPGLVCENSKDKDMPVFHVIQNIVVKDEHVLLITTALKTVCLVEHIHAYKVAHTVEAPCVLDVKDILHHKLFDILMSYACDSDLFIVPYSYM
ncbi:hypothetical protein Q7C36_023302 [Tachysurus vachellii]|uniref:Uncharacterized protein n=1 Tax=Tachysurus vachellii TaxID=175792 RepID=A0AA88LMV5_TACVA|nr:hypothetical protein Q7C36_023302 [Tachysurus vachellii]